MSIATPARPILLPLLVVMITLTGCSDSGPAEPTAPVFFRDVAFRYVSHLPPGSADPGEAGFCAHHLLGHSWLDVYLGDEHLVSVILRRDNSGGWVGIAEQLPTGVDLVATVLDLECCTHNDPCQPVLGLSADGVSLTRVAAVSLPGLEKPGLQFRISRRGAIIP